MFRKLAHGIKRLLPSLLVSLVAAGPVLAQFGSLPPFTIEIEPVPTTVPGIHSFAFAQSGSYWLIIGGRTNGLHGFSSNDGFPTMYANNDVVVIDTASWQYWTSSLSALPYSIADPLRSTNMQAFQDGDHLYISGGFGFDSVLYDYVTFPTLTAVHVDDMISAVQTGSSISPHIRQVTNNAFRVCGGEMFRLGSECYLIFGHNFQGWYTNPPTPMFSQTYTNQVRRFSLSDDGVNLSATNFTSFTDTAQFHRRDLNVFPLVKPDESFALGCYGGVFRYNVNLPFLNPVYIDTAGMQTDNSYDQVMSHYTCAGLPVFDSLTGAMHTTFFGGISLNDYDPSSNTVIADTLVPFISDITTLTKYANGLTEECVLPVQLPGLLGSNAEFMLNRNLPHYSNEVLRFRSLPNQRVLAGYLYGGIRANSPNLPLSSANDTVYRVYFTPDLSVSGVRSGEIDIEQLSLYPNPAQEFFTLQFKLNKAIEAEAVIVDLSGRRIAGLAKRSYAAGAHSLPVDVSGLKEGMYFLRLVTRGDQRVIKFTKD